MDVNVFNNLFVLAVQEIVLPNRALIVFGSIFSLSLWIEGCGRQNFRWPSCYYHDYVTLLAKGLLLIQLRYESIDFKIGRLPRWV